jgi:hypothetical protein
MRATQIVVVTTALALAIPAAAQERVTQGELNTLTSLVTASLSADARLDVLSSADVRQVVAFEAEKQAMGCSDDASCLAEVAGAMGAQLVCFGQVGLLGSQRVLTLNLFDAEAGQSKKRVVIKAANAEGVGEKLDAAVARLIADVPAVEGGADRSKLVVLDLASAAGEVADEPTPEPLPEASAAPSFPLLLVTGATAAGVGAVAGVVGGGLMWLAFGEQAKAESPTDTPSFADTRQALETRDGYATGAYALWGVGGALVVIGGAAAVAGLLTGGE